MTLKIPGQIRGSDAGRLMPLAIRIRRELEPFLTALGAEKLTNISVILRIGGNLGTFGSDALENIKINGTDAECDVVIEPRDWGSMTDDQISSLLRPRMIEALSTMITDAGYQPIPQFLHEQIEKKQNKTQRRRRGNCLIKLSLTPAHHCFDVRQKNMPATIPKLLRDKASEMPEIGHGATRVVLILKDEKRIEDVILAWGAEIVRIGEKEIKEESDIEFSRRDIVDIISA